MYRGITRAHEPPCGPAAGTKILMNMFELLATFSLSDLFLLGAFALSVVLVLKCSLQLLLGNQRARGWADAVFGIAALVTVGVLVVDAIHALDGQVGSDFRPLIGVPTIVLGLAAAWFHFRSCSLRAAASELRRMPAAWLLLASSLGLAMWSSYRFKCAMEPPAMDLPAVAERRVMLERETGYVGISDKGREIPLFRSKAAPISADQAYRMSFDPSRHVDNKVIVRSAPDTTSNCHGWVFTDGEFLLDIGGIKTILEDNGYEPVASPQAGDVIIYYLSGEVPDHTGLVSGVLHDGTVIIESKWGIEGRFLHRPEDQPYSKQYAYYRTPRGSNAISIHELPAGDSLAKQRLPRKRIKRA